MRISISNSIPESTLSIPGQLTLDCRQFKLELNTKWIEAHLIGIAFGALWNWPQTFFLILRASVLYIIFALSTMIHFQLSPSCSFISVLVPFFLSEILLHSLQLNSVYVLKLTSWGFKSFERSFFYPQQAIIPLKFCSTQCLCHSFRVHFILPASCFL